MGEQRNLSEVRVMVVALTGRLEVEGSWMEVCGWVGEAGGQVVLGWGYSPHSCCTAGWSCVLNNWL